MLLRDLQFVKAVIDFLSIVHLFLTLTVLQVEVTLLRAYLALAVQLATIVSFLSVASVPVDDFQDSIVPLDLPTQERFIACLSSITLDAQLGETFDFY